MMWVDPMTSQESLEKEGGSKIPEKEAEIGVTQLGAKACQASL